MAFWTHSPRGPFKAFADITLHCRRQQWRIVPPPPMPPRSSMFSFQVRKYRGIEIGGRQLLLFFATLEKILNPIWLVPEILSLVISLSVVRFRGPRFLHVFFPHIIIIADEICRLTYLSNVWIFSPLHKYFLIFYNCYTYIYQNYPRVETGRIILDIALIILLIIFHYFLCSRIVCLFSISHEIHQFIFMICWVKHF